jgi:hypothetical protein
MKTIYLETWEKFEEELKKLENIKEISKQRVPTFVPSDYLYRGQANAEWELKTTLERYLSRNICLLDYFHIMERVKPQIEAFTKKKWDIPSDYEEILKNKQLYLKGCIPPISEFMIHLRHHGFPSPLLDWSEDFLVAAFFAFSKTPDNATSVAIYAYAEQNLGTKEFFEDQPHIALVSTPSSQNRHVKQQSRYTVCGKKDEDDNIWKYAKHQDVFIQGNDKQDFLRKYILPVSEKKKVLQLLDGRNLNEFLLFGSEESLMSTVAMREMFFRE